MYFFIFVLFLIEIHANSEDPDQAHRSPASTLGLHCLPMSHKRDARHIWVKVKHLIKMEQHEKEIFKLGSRKTSKI